MNDTKGERGEWDLLEKLAGLNNKNVMCGGCWECVYVCIVSFREEGAEKQYWTPTWVPLRRPFRVRAANIME